ncbi:MAG: tRNA (adenosine(37)-N6)-threonylcarbamoyltransferase complex dimerization subunit type 1 TsaB [Deltaproteobacteria bacterium]|nr:tRNA (adenosine(37)-N6)-threonylcarbamoyltransferase complex dimerization subunit type 1 TsaB [Deltaproteobacteria bacterium]
MPILSVDSSSGYSNTLIMDADFNVIAETICGFHENHSVLLFKQIDKMLLKTGIRLSDLSGIVVLLGPGSFTGVRVSLTIAKTLSYTLGLNIIGLGSLFVCAYPFFKSNSTSKYIVAVKDAIKNSYYVSAFISKNGNFAPHLKISQFNLRELKSFVNGFDSIPAVVYGYNRKGRYEIFKSEFKENVPLNPFDLLKMPYYAAKYMLESTITNDLQYADGLSPYYVYGEGPF